MTRETTKTVLVTATGTIVAQGIMKSLRLANRDRRAAAPRYRIVAADMSPQAVGIYRGDVGIILPAAGAQDFVDRVIETCKKEAVTAIFVGSEEELGVLEAARGRILSESGAVLISNRAEVIGLGRDKWMTFKFLSERRIPCADSTLPSGLVEFLGRHAYPLVVKPRQGHGSLGVYIAKSRSELIAALRLLRRGGSAPIVQEYLRDEEQEYTTGVTTDRLGRVLSSIAMRRKLKGGQTAKAFVEDFPEIRRAAERVALAMGSVGPLNVQSRVEQGVSKVFEVNPRFSASCPIRAAAGVNEPDILYRSWVLKEGGLARPRPRELVALRYWNELYIQPREYAEVVESGRIRGGRGRRRSGSETCDYF